MCACAYAYSMTKVISLSDKAYKILKDQKGPNESFSDVVLRLSEGKEKKPLLQFAGSWNGDDAEKIFSRIQKERENSTSRTIEL